VRKPRVILCDDEVMIRDAFGRLLERRGYEVICSDTPITCTICRNGVDSCRQHTLLADILITDQIMPGMKGIELLEMLHRNGCKLDSRNKALITGCIDSTIEERVKELNCKFFPKPVRFSLLNEWLDDCETRFDLSQPLALQLVEFVNKKIIPF
jgi:CheY-like chemotaxis protein